MASQPFPYMGYDLHRMVEGRRPILGGVEIPSEKVLPYWERIREKLAEALGVEVGAVSVKAKTSEGVGPVGEGLAAEAHAVATVRQSLH